MKEFLTVIIPQKTSLYSLVHLRHVRLKTRSGRARDGPVGERRRITPKEVSRRPCAEREAPFWTWRRCGTRVQAHRLCRTRARAHRPWETRARAHRSCRSPRSSTQALQNPRSGGLAGRAFEHFGLGAPLSSRGCRRPGGETAAEQDLWNILRELNLWCSLCPIS